MTSLGFVSYIISAVFYTLLTVLLSTNWRGRVQGGLLLAAALVSLVWSVVGAFAGNIELISLKHLMALEVVRNLVWSAFIWKILGYTRQADTGLSKLVVIGFLLLCAATIAAELSSTVSTFLNRAGIDFRILSHLIQAVVGLFLVEQLFRNTRVEARWAMKFLCLGLGSLFIYDFMLYAEALLFGRIEPYLWDARGVVNAIIVPLLAISAVRNPQWSVEVFISRTMVFHTTALLAAGIYLLIMALVGYYIRDFGGSWGRIGQVVFVVGGLLVLFLLLFSGRIRSIVKVFFNQHFFTYKYDYRREWLALNRAMAAENRGGPLAENCLLALCEMVDSPAGALWVRQEGECFRLLVERNTHLEGMEQLRADDSLIAFLQAKQWVVEAPEYLCTPELYEGLSLDLWAESVPGFWLAVPLIQRNSLYGFAVLTNPRAARQVNWEDHDLLKTVGQQMANYLALIDASAALANARQFEAYNRLSAFMVHDLKNLVAQLSLVVKNAEKHKHNPDFIDDALDTLSNSVTKMNRLLAQLRKGEIQQQRTSKIDLLDAIDSVVKQQNDASPIPEKSTLAKGPLYVSVDADKLVAVLGHLVQNAQDATPENGWVRLSLVQEKNFAVIEISDNGCGMDKKFIRERLFKPFDTTKGNAGMGIGVFEARQFAQSHDGKLEVESAPGSGSCFKLKLPLSELSQRETDLPIQGECMSGKQVPVPGIVADRTKRVVQG